MFEMKLIKKLKTSYSIRLSGDKRFLCHNMSNKTIVYDITTWEKVAELNKPNYPGDIRFSLDNDYLLIKSTTGTICVYRTADFQLVRKVQSKKSFKLVEGDVNFTKDHSLILSAVETNNGRQIGAIHIHTGEYTVLTKFENAHPLIYYHQFVGDRDEHLFTLSYVNEIDYRENRIVRLKEPINKQPIELKSHPEVPIWDSVVFDPVHDVYILVDNYEVILMDSDFKSVLKKVHIVGNRFTERQIGFFRHLHQSQDGRFIVLTYSECVLILRYEDLKTIWIESVPYASFAEFSNDDQYLLVGTWECGYVFENNLPQRF